MASLTFKKRDKNRFKKTYPAYRRRPDNEFVPTGPFLLEIGELTFTHETSVSYTFTTAFTTTPVVTAIAVDSESNDEANINVYISSLSSTSVTFSVSKSFTGQVHFQATEVG